MLFEWDDEKEKINIAKHGIDFETAARVFKDENRLELYDEAHSDTEDRYITIGIIDGVAYLVMVVYLEFPYFSIGRKSSEQSRTNNCLKTILCFMIATICVQ